MRKSRVPVKYEDSETVVTCAVGMLKQWFESGEKLEMQERHRCSDLFDFQIQLPLLSFSQCSLLNDIMWTEEKTYILYAALVMAATSQIFGSTFICLAMCCRSCFWAHSCSWPWIVRGASPMGSGWPLVSQQAVLCFILDS